MLIHSICEISTAMKIPLCIPLLGIARPQSHCYWETEHYHSVWEITVQFYFWEYINGNQTFILDWIYIGPHLQWGIILYDCISPGLLMEQSDIRKIANAWGPNECTYTNAWLLVNNLILTNLVKFFYGFAKEGLKRGQTFKRDVSSSLFSSEILRICNLRLRRQSNYLRFAICGLKK